MIRLAVGVVALAMATTTCLAQNNAAQNDPSTDALIVAEHILDVTGAKARTMQVVDLMLPSVTELIKKQVPDISDKVLQDFKAAFHDEMQKTVPDVLRAEARVYAMHFTTAELNDLLAFYHTPLGQKMLVEQPKIIQEILPLGKEWGREAGERAMLNAI